MNKIFIIIDGISEWTGKAVSFLIIPIILVITYEIVLRGVFNLPQIWTHDLSCYLFAALFMIGGAYTLRYGGHVNMDIFSSRLSPRKRAILDIITAPLIFLICGVIIWKAGLATIEAIKFGFEYASSWAPPMWPLKGAVTLGAILVTLQALAMLSRNIRTAISGNKL